MVILGVLINETCYKTGRVSTRDFMVYELYITVETQDENKAVGYGKKHVDFPFPSFMYVV